MPNEVSEGVLFGLEGQNVATFMRKWTKEPLVSGRADRQHQVGNTKPGRGTESTTTLVQSMSW